MGCIQLQAGQNVLSPLFMNGLIRWWDADRLFPGTNGFVDLSGNSLASTNANISVIPGVVNGRPVVRYNGVNSATTTSQFSPGGQFACFMVMKLAVAGGVMVGFCNAAATNQLLVSNAGENLACFDNVNHPTSAAIDNHTAFTVVGVVCRGALGTTFYQNGAVVTGPIGTFNSLTLLINFGAVIGVFSAFDVAEVVVYDATSVFVTNPNQFLPVLTEYFRGKYNLF